AFRSSRQAALRVGRSLDKLGADTDAVLDHLIRYQIGVLEDARGTVDPAHFRRAVDLILSAARIVVVGPGPNQGLVEHFVNGLRRFGRRALPITQRGQALADALMELGAGDVVVLLAYERTSNEVEVILDRARDVRSPVVLVTDSLAVALAGRYAVVLSATRGSSTMFPTQVVTLALIEALLRALAALGAAAVLPNVMATVADRFAYRERGRVVANIFVANTLGNLAGLAVAGIIAEQLGWRVSLAFAGVLALATFGVLAGLHGRANTVRVRIGIRSLYASVLGDRSAMAL